ncbi:MAG: hypothetical protein KDK91_24845 [Gammaproteobacteria bacterium]|nr:hypothetical protein [Gammaproteobacteria bacterium]
MSHRDRRALALIVAAAAVCALFLMGQRLRSARSDATAAVAEHSQALLQCRQLEDLRSKEQLIDDVAAPEPDLIASLEVQMASSGITSPIDRFRMGTPQPVRDTPYQRQVATVTIQSVPPPVLAQFVVNWNTRQPRWILRSVTLDHPPVDRVSGDRRQGRTARWDATGRYTVQLTLENTFLAGSAGTRDQP